MNIISSFYIENNNETKDFYEPYTSVKNALKIVEREIEKGESLMSFVIEDYYNIMDKYDNCSDRKTMMNEFLNYKRKGIQYKEFLKGFIFLDNIKKQKMDDECQAVEDAVLVINSYLNMVGLIKD